MIDYYDYGASIYLPPNLSIPKDERNADYRQFLALVGAGQAQLLPRETPDQIAKQKETNDAAASSIALDYRYAAELRAKGDVASRLDAYDFLTKKGLPPWP